MSDLLTRLEEYGVRHDEIQGAVDIEQVLREGPAPHVGFRPEAPGGNRRRNGALVALTAAAAVLIGIGLVAFLLAGDLGGSLEPSPVAGPVEASSLEDRIVTDLTGKTAPTAPLIQPDGTVSTVADYGKAVVLVWAPWCEPCNDDISAFNAVSLDYPNTLFLAIANPSEGFASGPVLERKGIDNILTADSEQFLRQLDQLSAEMIGPPIILFIDDDSTIVAAYLGHATQTEIRQIIQMVGWDTAP